MSQALAARTGVVIDVRTHFLHGVSAKIGLRIDLRQFVKTFYLIGYIWFEKVVVDRLQSRLPPQSSDEDILFQFDFAHINLNI